MPGRRSGRCLPEPPILLITEASLAPDGLEAQVKGALDGGCRWVLLRDKTLDAAARLAWLRRLQPLLCAVEGLLCVSDDLDLAGLAGGCHLNRQRDPRQARAALGPEALIGYSAHNLEEARFAEQRGADYITLSPIFAPISKPGHGPALGKSGLAETAAALSIPVLALGGITAAEVQPCLQAGARGVAVMGSVMAASDPGNIFISLKQSFKNMY